MSIKKLDEFINRQGIVSAELCKIVDNIESENQQLKELLREACEIIEDIKNRVSLKDMSLARLYFASATFLNQDKLKEIIKDKK